MLREQSESIMPTTEDAAIYSMNQEEADELFRQLSLHLAEHGEEDHRTKAVLNRIEQLGLTIKFAMDKARLLDKAYGKDQPAPKSQRPAAGGATETKEKGGAAASGGRTDRLEKPGKLGGPPAGGGAGDRDASSKLPRTTGGGGTDRDPKMTATAAGGGGEGKGGR